MSRMHGRSNRHRSGITLVEMVLSLSIMSILLLGLSGAVMIGSNAIPTATETGLADQKVIDSLNRLRSDLRQATSIAYVSRVAGEQIVLTIKDSGAAGTPKEVRYLYRKSTNSFYRKADAAAELELFGNIASFGVRIILDGSEVSVVSLSIAVDETIKNFFELHVALPDKPEML